MHPPVFSDLSFDDALAAAKNADKVLLVDATASWCQPCKHMDKTTWVDGSVIAAIGERAIAIQFDVDEHKDLAKKLSVKAMPTVIAFKGGKEVDRIVGVRGPARFVAWLDGLARGETSLDAARTTVRDNPSDLKARVALAQMLVERDALDEATSEYETVWKAMDSPALLVMKHGFLAAQLNQLVAQHPGARETFTRVRNASEAGTRDWITLNLVLGDTERTLSWYESVRDRVHEDDALAELVQGTVIPLLVQKERWAEAGRALARPMKVMEQVLERKKRATQAVAGMTEDQAKQVFEMLDKMNAQEVLVLRRALAAAGRDDEMRAVEEAAKNGDPAWLTPLPK